MATVLNFQRKLVHMILGFFVLTSMIACTNDSDSKVTSNGHQKQPMFCPINDDGGEVTDFGIIGGKTLAQSSNLAKGVVKLYIYFFDKSNDELLSGSSCTGSLIDSNIILTAAHCVTPRKDIIEDSKSSQVYLKAAAVYGSTTLCRLSNKDLSKAMAVDAVKVHEKYGSKEGGDIALLRLSEPMPGEHVFYQLDEETHDFPQDEKLIVVGYGNSKGYEAEEKEEVPLKLGFIRSNKSKQFRDDYLSLVLSLLSSSNKESIFDYSSKVETLIFDQSYNEGVCAGDSGGPGLRFFRNTLKIVGVAQSVRRRSYSDDPCKFGSQFTNVSFYIDWIIKNFNELSNSESRVRTRGESLFN